MGYTPEGKIKARVRRILEINHAYHFMPATGGYGRAGVPDFVGCYYGTFYAVECKGSINDKLTQLQQREIDRIAKAGGNAFIVYDDISLKTLEQWLRITKAAAEIDDRS